MIKKIVSIFLISLLAVCCLSSVYAISDHKDVYFDAGSDFTSDDVISQAGDYIYNPGQINDGIRQSGLCQEIDYYRETLSMYPHWTYHPVRYGNYTMTIEPLDGDDDYLTIHIVPRQLKLSELYGNGPRLDDKLGLTGIVLCKYVKYTSGHDVLSNSATMDAMVYDDSNCGPFEIVRKLRNPAYFNLDELGTAFDPGHLINIDLTLHSNNPIWADATMHRTFHT
jgi:hypothetical protein